MTRATITALAIALTMLAQPARTAAGEEYVSGGGIFDDYLNPVENPSFLGLEGISFSSSAGFLYSSGGTRGADGSAFYMGHFSYELASNLTLRWDVGLRSSMVGPEAGGDPEFFIPNVDLTYRPSDRMMFTLRFGRYGLNTQSYLMRR